MNVQVFARPLTSAQADNGKGPRVSFSPILTIPKGVTDVSFYEKAFGAFEGRRFGNDDGTIHVSEFDINGTLFHLHEEMRPSGQSPATARTTTVTIGLFVDDVDKVVESAIAAGATLSSPAQDYDYGYRQANVIDPFGHDWQIQKAI